MNGKGGHRDPSNHSLKLQLMGNAIFDSADGTDVPQQLEDSCAQHTRIIDSLHHKRAALGVDEHAHLTLIH
jgi:hypothetical protein